MIGRGDTTSIDRISFFFEHDPKVTEIGRLWILFSTGSGLSVVNITKGYDINKRTLGKRINIAFAFSAYSYGSNIELVTWCYKASAQDMPRNNKKTGRG
jgi:hypothetical protein